MVHYLENYPKLRNKSTGSLREVRATLFRNDIKPTKLNQPNLFTPLHIASADDRSAIPLIILIKVRCIRFDIMGHLDGYIPIFLWFVN